MTNRPSARAAACAAILLALCGASPGRRPAVTTVVGASGQPPATDPARLEDAYRLNNLGVAQLEQYDYEAAAATFEKALTLVPTLQLARINLAIAQMHAGKLPEAQAAAEQARAADASAPQPHYVLGLVARANTDAEAAARDFERALEIDPRDLGTLVNLGQLRMQERRYDEAITLFRRAVEAEPYHVTAAYNLSVALTRGGQTDEAARAVERFQQLRESAYGTAFSNNYLERGRYAIALSSTGAERGLVDPEVPTVRFVAEATWNPDTPLDPAAVGRAAATLADVDRDGDLDLVTAGPAGSALFVNDAGRMSRVSGDAEPPWPPRSTNAVIVADYDNDRAPDIAVATAEGVLLLRQARPGRFYDVGKDAGLGGAPAAAALAFVDTDHDGDVDLLVAGADRGKGAASSAHLFRNNGTGAFTDVTVEAKLATPARDVAVVPTDFDNRRDVDLLFLAGDGPPRLMRNLRDGRFADAAGSAGLTLTPGGRAVAAGDVNKDGFTDFFVSRDGDSRFELSDGTGGFEAQPGPAGAEGATAAMLLDYDNDGVLDLVALVAGGARTWRNLGRQWQDVTREAVAGAPSGDRGPAAAEALAAGDVDRDGDTDLVLVAPDGGVRLLRNDGGSRRTSLPVRLTGKVSNLSGVGANVELRAGSLWQKLELTSTSPSVAPGSLVFGLGGRGRADVVRVLWPSGVLQAETADGADTSAGGLEITELDRKPSSCPFLYTWNGTRFEFLTDFLGSGELGYLHAPGVRSQPDPDEYVRITGDRLLPRDGRLELRVTNELEEAVFLDRLQLLAVRHPAGTEVFPAEGMKSGPSAAFGVYVTSSLRPPSSAVDHRGRDVLEALRETDRRDVDGFAVEAIRGYAKRHSLTLDLADPVNPATAAAGPDGRILLVLTGWTDYAFSSDNVAAHQAGLRLEPPSLQVKDEEGRWQTVIAEIGVPVGRPQSVVVDLTGKFLSASREVRVVTTMRVYWDRALVDTSGTARFVSGAALEAHSPDGRGTVLSRLEPVRADLSWRGFSAEVRPEGRGPLSYDYDRVSASTPWKLMPGRYTREGDVRELVGSVDDMFVVSRPGDELAVAFDARQLPVAAEGTTLTYLLFAHGYSKEMDLSSASPDQVAPLPFRGMSSYPYVAPERYPDTAAHRDYLARYNTRVVGRALPPLVPSGPTADAGDASGQPDR